MNKKNKAVTIFTTKGGAGKTPISANFHFDKGFCIGTNEPTPVYEDFMSDDQLLTVSMEEAFPKVQDTNIVFDLAGSISKNAKSITSAISMSDIVIVPIYNEYKSLKSGGHTILEIQKVEPNIPIVVVATKLTKNRHDVFTSDWTKSGDYLNIKKIVDDNFNNIEVLPLKLSKVFDNMFEHEASIRQIMETNPLAANSYKVVAKQFDDLYAFLGL